MGDVRPPGTPVNGDSPIILLGRYRVDAILGKGGFGEVVRAFDPRIRRHVAIKTLNRALASDTDEFKAVRDRFEREAEAGSRMGVHPHVVTVHDLIADADGTLYLILEYLPGGTLADRLKGGPLPAAEALRLTADAARGLHAAHETGIVHRDVKPANLFLTRDGRGKVGDFGVAQIDDLSQRSRLATAQEMFHPGTALYMSPEQRTKSDYLRGASDEYALGLVLYELLTGQAYKRLSPTRARELLAGQAPDVRALVERMTAEDEEERHETLAAMATAAEAILPTLRPGAGPSPGAEQATVIPVRPPSGPSGPIPLVPEESEATEPAALPPHTVPMRNRQPAPVITPLLATPHEPEGEGETQHAAQLAARQEGVAAARPVPDVPEERRVSRRALLAGIGGVAVVGGGAAGVWAFSRTGNAGTATPTTAAAIIAASATSIPATATSVPATPTALALIATTAGFALQGQSGSVSGVAFSPDGQMLAASGGKTVRLWRMNDGGLIRELEGHTDWVYATAFSPDGQTLASGSVDTTVRLWRVSDGSLIRELKGHTNTVNSVAFSPDGRTLASGSVDTTVRLWRVSDGGPLLTLRGHTYSVKSVAFSPDGQTIASGSADSTVRLWRL